MATRALGVNAALVDLQTVSSKDWLTWKLVSFQPGFLASIRTKAWQGISTVSMVSTACKQTHQRIDQRSCVLLRNTPANRLQWRRFTHKTSPWHEFKRRAVPRQSIIWCLWKCALWGIHLNSAMSRSRMQKVWNIKMISNLRAHSSHDAHQNTHIWLAD